MGGEMTGVATIICLALALVTALSSGLHALRDRATTQADFVAAGLTEIAVLFYVVLRSIDLAQGHHVSGLAIVIAYLAGLILALPVTAALSYAEPTRWGSVTMAAGAIVVCVLFARINELWTPHG
jgi:hypothetical protein